MHNIQSSPSIAPVYSINVTGLRQIEHNTIYVCIQGYSTLHHAASSGSIAVMHLLLSAGADANAKNPRVSGLFCTFAGHDQT